jgi:virginiamycin A acetyltransferase
MSVPPALPDTFSAAPIPGWHGTSYLKAIIRNPRIHVGDFSYYDDSRGPQHFEARCVRYLFDQTEDNLRIGKFVAIAQGAQFIMSGANHPLGGFSTFPFGSFEGWGEDAPERWVNKGDIVIGDDVWIGREAVIMPGVTIGAGSVIGTRAVVAKDVPPYSIIVGNPGRVVRQRFEDAVISRLLAIRWWDWPVESILAHRAEIAGGDLAALEAAARLVRGETPA